MRDTEIVRVTEVISTSVAWATCIAAKRLLRRLRHLLRFGEIWRWKNESCERCGSCFKLAYSLRDETWNAIYGNENGCYCLDCAIAVAKRRGVRITADDVTWLALFDGDEFATIIEYEGPDA